MPVDTARWQHWRDGWRRFQRHRAALTGLCVLGLMLLLVGTAPLWTAHDPTRQQLVASPATHLSAAPVRHRSSRA